MNGTTPAPARLRDRLAGLALGRNLMAGLTVSFVALSLGAAFGVLSGRGAFAGMLSAAAFGLITSLFGGTRIQCSGPTGPMTAVSAVVIALAHDQAGLAAAGWSPDQFIALVFWLTAAILLAAALLRLGKFITLVPNVVISGFMNGIAVIIWLDQLKKLFGFGGKTAYEGWLPANLMVMAATTVLVFTLPKLLGLAKRSWTSLLSSTFLAIIIMSVVSNLLNLPVEKVSLASSLHGWGDFAALVQAQLPPGFDWNIILLALPLALKLAVLAYLDTLMTSLVIDKLTGTTTRPNQELAAQGLGTAAIAAIGGIPGAQATIRSVLIVKEGATSRLAGILVGLFAFAELLMFQDWLSLIPQAVFAGVLVKVGYDVFDFMPFKLYAREWRRHRIEPAHPFAEHPEIRIYVSTSEILIIIGTTLVTVLWDLNVAVFGFSALFWFINKVLRKDRPLRDLKPVASSGGAIREQ